jgi:hypothetical protein
MMFKAQSTSGWAMRWCLLTAMVRLDSIWAQDSQVAMPSPEQIDACAKWHDTDDLSPSPYWYVNILSVKVCSDPYPAGRLAG